MLAVQPVSESVFPPHLFHVPLNKFQTIAIQLNENPMYIDEKGERHLEEPMYQAVIRVPSIGMVMYEYFDSPTEQEAVHFIHQMKAELQSLGFPWVACFC